MLRVRMKKVRTWEKEWEYGLNTSFQRLSKRLHVCSGTPGWTDLALKMICRKQSLHYEKKKKL